MKAANDAVRFVVEVAVLIAVGYWGFHEHSSWLAKLALGAGAPLLIAVVWGLWMAPQSSRRAGEGTRVVLEVLILRPPLRSLRQPARSSRLSSRRSPQ
jgi:hypothetical protein